MRKAFLVLLFSILPFGFSQATNSTNKVCVIEKQTLMGKVICFIPCKDVKGGKK